MELLWIVISISAKIRITASFCSETPLLFTFSAIKMLKIDICYLFITWRTDKALKVCCALIKFQARNPNEYLGKTFFIRSLFFFSPIACFIFFVWFGIGWFDWFGLEFLHTSGLLLCLKLSRIWFCMDPFSIWYIFSASVLLDHILIAFVTNI